MMRESGFFFYRRPLGLCVWRYGLGAVSIGYQPETRRHGIFIALGRRHNPPEGEIVFRWWWRWSVPTIRLIRCRFNDGDGLTPHSSAWTGRTSAIVGVEAFGRGWWWK